MMSLSILAKKENYSKMLIMIIMLRYWVMAVYCIVICFKFASQKNKEKTHHHHSASDPRVTGHPETINFLV